MHNLCKSLVRGHSDFHKTDFVEWEFDAICAALMSVGFSSCISFFTPMFTIVVILFVL